MLQTLRLRRSSLRRKIPVATLISLFVTLCAIGFSVGTTSGAPIFSPPVTAAQSRLYYDANVRIRKDGLAFAVGVKAEWLGLTVLNNGASYTDSVNIGNGDTNGDKYPWLAFSPVDGTGYVAWNSITSGSGRSYETYVRVIPPAYNGVSNTTLGPVKRIYDITGYQLAQPSIGVDSTGAIYVTGYGVTSPVSLILFKFDSNFNLQGPPQIIDQQPAGARSEMDTQMCINSANDIHIISFFPYGTDATAPTRLYAYSRVSSPSFVKTDITPTGWTLKKGRQGKDVACAADGSVYVAINNNGRYDMFKRDAGTGGSEKWHQVQSTLFNTAYATSVGVGTSLDGRVWATQGDGATSPSDPNPIIGTNVKYSSDGGVTFSANERAIPAGAYQNMSVAIDGNGPGGKVHLIGSFYFTSGDFSVTTKYATADSITNLPAPANLVATPAGQNQINLSWTATNPAADQYQILRATSPGGPFTQVGISTNTSFQDTSGLTFGTTYYYQVTATKTGYNNSGPSNVASATTYGPAGVVFIAQPGNGTAAAPLNPLPTVKVVDQVGNTVAGYNGSVTFSIAPGTGTPGASLNGQVTQTITNGVSSFTGTALSIDSVGAGYRLKAVAGGFSALSNPFNQTGNLAVTLVSNPITATVPFSVKVTVQVNGGGTDTHYNGQVFLAFSPTGGVYTYGPTTEIGASGVATFTNQMIDTAGSGYVYTASLPNGLASGTLNSVTVNPYTEPGTPAECTRILLSSTVSTCNANPNTLTAAFTLAGSKPVYVDHKTLGPTVYMLPPQPVTIPPGSWLDAGCSGPSGNPWGMQINISNTNIFTINGGNTFLRGLYLTGSTGSNALLGVQSGQTGNTFTCGKVAIAAT